MRVRASVNGAAPVTLGSADPVYAPVAAAIAADGRAVVAWVEARHDKRRIVAARRAPGAGFGAVEPLSDWRRGIGDPRVAAAVAADGTTTVAWMQPLPGRSILGRAQVATERAVAGGPFVRQRIADRVRGVTTLTLATAPDGWTLLPGARAPRPRSRSRASRVRWIRRGRTSPPRSPRP
jgi:hypothetical protein